VLTKKTFSGMLFIPPGIPPRQAKKDLRYKLNRIKRKIISLHPCHWFDGFMDGIKIDLKEFE
jgi:hypothetical protein